MVDGIDEHRDAEHVGQKDELLARIRACLPGAGQEIDGNAPFRLGQLHILDEGMQVADERGHDAGKAR